MKTLFVILGAILLATSRARCADDEQKPLVEQVLEAQKLLLAGKHAEGEAIFRKALEQLIAEEGADHPAVGIYKGGLAWAARAQGRLEEAEALYREATELLEKEFGQSHCATMMMRYEHAGTLNQMKRYADAAAGLERLVDGMKQAGPKDNVPLSGMDSLGSMKQWVAPDNLLRSRVLMMLGKMYSETSRKDDARRVVREAEIFLHKDFAEGHPHLVEVAKALAEIDGKADDGTLVGERGASLRIHFSGQHTFTEAHLQQGLAANPAFVLSGHPREKLEPFTARIQELLLRGYRSEGFPDVKVEFRPEAKAKELHFAITEGPRYRCGTVKFEGAKLLPADEIIRRLTTKKEDSAGSDPWSEPEQKFLKAYIDKLAAEAAAKKDEKNTSATSTKSSTNSSGTDLFASISLSQGGAQTGNFSSSDPGGSWIKGHPVDFYQTAAETGSTVSRMAAEMGFLRSKLEVEVVRDSGTGTADLLVKVKEEGMPATIASLAVEGHRWNKGDGILAFTGLKPGQSWTRERQREVRRKLWESGRFINFAVFAKPRAADATASAAVDVTVLVEEWWEAPPLTTPLTRAEQAWMRAMQWLATAREREDLQFDVTGPDGVAVQGALAWGKGLAIQADGGNALPLRAGVLFSADRIMARIEKDGKVFEAVSTGLETSKVQGKVHFLADSEGEGEAKGSIQFGAGFSSISEGGISIIFHPLLALRTVIEADGVQCVVENGTLRVTQAGAWWEFDETTGRLVRGELSAPGNWKAVVRAVPGSFESLTSGMMQPPAAGQPVQRLEFETLSEWLLLLPLLGADHDALGPLPPEVWQRALNAVQKILAEVVPGKGNDDSLFYVPSTAAEYMTHKNPMMVLVGSVILTVVESYLPAGAWATRLGREIVFISAGRMEHTSETLEELLTDESMGPFACVACAQTLNVLSLGGGPVFARKGLGLLTKEDFRKDWQPLLNPGSGVGRIFQTTLKMLATLTPDEVEAIVQVIEAGWEKEAGLAARGLFLALQTAGDRPPVEVLTPLMDSAFEYVIKELLEDLLKQIAAPEGSADPKLVAAVVNGRPISREQLKAAAILGGIPEKEALPKLIEEEVVAQKMESQGRKPAQEKVMQLLEQYAQPYDDAETYLKALEEKGVARNLVGWRLMRTATIMDAVTALNTKVDPVTDKDVEAALAGELTNAGEEIHLHAITLSPGDKLTPEAAEAITREVSRKLKEGADFGEMAKAHSTDSSAANKGCRGWVARGTLSAEFEKKAFALKDGENSDVFNAGGDWFILRVMGRRQAKVEATAEFREKLRRRLTGKRALEAGAALVKELKEAAKIEILTAPATEEKSGEKPAAVRPAEFAGVPSEFNPLRARAAEGDALAQTVLMQVLYDCGDETAALHWGRRAGAGSDVLVRAMVQNLDADRNRTQEEGSLESVREEMVEWYAGVSEYVGTMGGRRAPPAAPAPPSDLERAAAAGDPWACFLMGNLPEKSPLSSGDVDSGEWLEKAAQAGVAPAMLRHFKSRRDVVISRIKMGSMKEEDLVPLMEMAEKTAAKKLPAAEMKLAEVLKEGRGVPKDLRRAALILQQQAEAGVADAAWQLGTCHERGLGVNRDLAAAVKWYELASAAGDAEARARLNALRQWQLVQPGNPWEDQPASTPQSFDVHTSGKSQSGWHHWLRHGSVWTEILPDGKRQAFLTTGRETVNGSTGTVAVRTGKGVMPGSTDAAVVQVFIPDKSTAPEAKPQLFIRERSNAAAAWGDWKQTGAIVECL